MAEVDEFQRKLAIDKRHNDIAMLRLQRLVDDHDVALVDACVDHRVARHHAVEGSLGILDDVAVEVDRVVHVVLGRAGKSGLDRGRELQRQFLGKFSFESTLKSPHLQRANFFCRISF